MSQIANSADTERVERSESGCLQQLVIACQEDRTRFQEIYLLFIKPVFAYILGLVRNRELAEDLTSETFIKAFTSICQLNRPEKFTAWIFTIARNKTIDFFRNQRKNQFIEFEDELEIETFATPEGLHHDTSAFIKTLISTLNERERELILLKYYSGLTFKQISQVLKRPESTIKMEIYRTLRKMEMMLEDTDEK